MFDLKCKHNAQLNHYFESIRLAKQFFFTLKFLGTFFLFSYIKKCLLKNFRVKKTVMTFSKTFSTHQKIKTSKITSLQRPSGKH